MCSVCSLCYVLLSRLPSFVPTYCSGNSLSLLGPSGSIIPSTFYYVWQDCWDASGWPACLAVYLGRTNLSVTVVLQPSCPSVSQVYSSSSFSLGRFLIPQKFMSNGPSIVYSILLQSYGPLVLSLMSDTLSQLLSKTTSDTS